jgi:osmoprotectant transport system permease protein
VDEGEAHMMTVLAKSDSFVHAFTFIGDNQHLMWEKTLAHLKISFASVAVAILLAVPLGVWLGHLHRGSFFAINVSNIGRALPSLAVISIGIGILGIGFTNVLVALVILAGPVILTNAYVAVDGVDRNAVQAAYAMGMKQWQVLLRVEIPLALPLIFAGIRTATVYVVATATLATFAGGGGLGDIIVNQASYGVSGVVAGSLFITALAFLVDGILALVQRVITPAPLRPKWGLGRRSQQVRAATESI